MKGFTSSTIKCASIAGLALMLGACATTTPRYVASVEPGSSLEIKQSLRIPDGRARVYIQDGKVVSQNSINRFGVYCGVSMNRLHRVGEAALTVEPGDFRISEVRQYNSVNRTHRIYVAAMGGNLEYPANIVYYVDMRLQDDQPDVRALICMKHNNPTTYIDSRQYYPSRAEIEATLSGLIELK